MTGAFMKSDVLNNLAFEKATRGDINTVVGIYRSLYGMPGSTWDEGYPNEETAEQDISRGWLYVLKEQGAIVAVASIGDFRELGEMEWKPKNPCELARIGVSPKFHRQGIGSLMLKHCIEIAKAQGFDGMRFLVAKINARALAMYEKNGFERCGEAVMYDIDFFQYQMCFK